MAFQKSTTVRNAELDQIETTIGTTVTLVLFSGAEPANCAAADPSGVLATITFQDGHMVGCGKRERDCGELAPQRRRRRCSSTGQHDRYDVR